MDRRGEGYLFWRRGGVDKRKGSKLTFGRLLGTIDIVDLRRPEDASAENESSE